MPTAEEIQALAELAVGRNPSWSAEIEVDNTEGGALDGSYDSALNGIGPPALGLTGIDLVDAVKALASIELREDPRFRTSRLSIGTYDATTDYKIAINGTTFSSGTTHTTHEEAIDDLVTAVTGGGEPVTATTEGSGTESKLLVKGDEIDDYTVTRPAPAGGTGTSSLSADATTAEVDFHFAPENWTGANKWKGPPETITCTFRGWIDRLTVSGLAECYPEVISCDGKVRVAVGPAVAE